MIYEYRLPSPPLREYVRLLQIIHLDFSKVPVVPFKPYWPRPDHCLAFYPRDHETVEYVDSGRQEAKPRSALIGQPTVVTNRYVGRDFFVFQVVFQPGALFRLTGLPAHALTNTFLDAEAVFSPEIKRVNDRLGSTDRYPDMIQIVEQFLHYLIRKSKRDRLPIDKVSHWMLHAPQGTSPLLRSVDWLAKEACLSPKQFYRQSVERLGVSPKLFDRIIRFDQAVKYNNAQPRKDWLSIALETGYHDYQHLVRDFRTFTTLTPPQFAQQDSKAPERSFGIAEK
ncbi:helix-turn-helix domain-containing protein [Rhabdobacter roseus]|uniref:AraC-like DNA-binding protein n=1 Tax=Rhabdobacter roseus TaxID=1655419 RepID=A0A840U2J9_9BACT|nr:helix-turn-helix domain-containing protein [Rhabdobacter roseus]MBB5286069.1 AraC-like DNA-binding protein [Rhabdobacter roseus]